MPLSKLVDQYMNGKGWPETRPSLPAVWPQDDCHSVVLGPYSCYSDGCVRDGVMSYGVIVLKKFEIIHRSSQALRGGSSMRAELLGTLSALKIVPDKAGGTAYSDLSNIIELVGQKTPVDHPQKALLLDIHRELIRTGCTLEYMPKGSRSHYYTECHRLAALANREYRLKRLKEMTSGFETKGATSAFLQ